MELHNIRKHASLRVPFDNTAAQAYLPFAMLDTSQIQEIQRIKNIITNIYLENMGQTQVDSDVKQRPGYKAVVL
jgi:hypothetical protein